MIAGKIVREYNVLNQSYNSKKGDKKGHEKYKFATHNDLYLALNLLIYFGN